MSDELRDDRTPLPGKPWLVRLTCCGRADGVYAALTWEEADRFRLSYTAPGHYEDVSGLGGGHRRSAVIEDGYAPALAAHRVEPAPTLDERARVERDARLRDARDALDMAALWLHRTFDLPARDSQQAESWERKARSGRAALAAEAPERPQLTLPEPERPA